MKKVKKFVEISYPLNKELKLEAVKRENQKRLDVKKKFGIIEEKERIERIKGRSYYIIEATFFNNYKIEKAQIKVDLTELASLGVNPKEVLGTLMIANEEGIVVYMSKQVDENIKKWAKENKIKDYKLRKDIIGKEKITSYIKGKEKLLMQSIIHDTKRGNIMIRETNVAPWEYKRLQCKSKDMTHVVNVYWSDDNLFFHFSINLSKPSQRLWKDIKKTLNSSQFIIKERTVFPMIIESFAKSIKTLNHIPTQKIGIEDPTFSRLAMQLNQKLLNSSPPSFNQKTFSLSLKEQSITKETPIDNRILSIISYPVDSSLKAEFLNYLLSLDESKIEKALLLFEIFSSMVKEEKKEEVFNLVTTFTECSSSLLTN